MATIDDLAERLSKYLNASQIQQVCRAYYYAEQAHKGKLRLIGELYFINPLAFVNIFADMHLDHKSLMAAMLHEVFEDIGVPKDAFAEHFGDAVTELVDGV